ARPEQDEPGQGDQGEDPDHHGQDRLRPLVGDRGRVAVGVVVTHAPSVAHPGPRVRSRRRGAARLRSVSAPAVDQATLDTAVALLREAGERTLRWFRADDLSVERKADGTPVTAADRGA